MKKSQQCQLLAYGLGFIFILEMLLSSQSFLWSAKNSIGRDFFQLYQSSISLSPYHHDLKNLHLPLIYLFILPLTHFAKEDALFIYLGIFISLFAIFNWLILIKPYACVFKKPALRQYILFVAFLFVFTFFSYPAFQLISTGNVEAYLFLFLVGFLYSFMHKKNKFSVLFLSIAIATAIYPAIFILVYLKEKQHKEIFWTIFLSIGLITLSLFFLNPTPLQNLSAFSENVGWFHHTILHTPNVINHNTSLFATFNIFKIFSGGKIIFPISPHQLWVYFILTFSFLMLAILYVTLIETILWKKLFVLVCTLVLLPHVVLPYKLIYFYLPLYAFIETSNKTTSFFAPFYLLAFVILLSSNDFFHLNGIAISPLLNFSLLSLMLVCLIGETIYTKRRYFMH